MVNPKLKDILVGSSWLIIYAALTIIIFPMFVGLGPFAGFESEAILTKFMFYQSGFSVLGLIAVYIIGYFVKYNESLGVGILHNPEKAPSLFSFIKPPRIIKNPVLLFFLMWLIFAPMFLLASTQNTFFSAIPHIEMQVAETAHVIFAMWPASPSETLSCVFLISLFLLLLRMFLGRKINKGVYMLLALVGGMFIAGMYGSINHSLRYGFSEISSMNVIIFWSFLGLITIVFNSVIPPLVLHDANNLFVKLNDLFSSEIIYGITIAIWVSLLILFVFFILVTKKKKGEGIP